MKKFNNLDEIEIGFTKGIEKQARRRVFISSLFKFL